MMSGKMNINYKSIINNYNYRNRLESSSNRLELKIAGLTSDIYILNQRKLELYNDLKKYADVNPRVIFNLKIIQIKEQEMNDWKKTCKEY